jgi:proton glutamate symport protein
MIKPTPETPVTKRPWYKPSLTTQILIGLVLGGVLGKLSPDWGEKVYFLRDIFLNMIKSIIAPLVFSTLVVGIAGGGDLKKVGRMGAKALLYFEIVTTLALFIGLRIVNLTRPGIGYRLWQTQAKLPHSHKPIPRRWSKQLFTSFRPALSIRWLRATYCEIVAFSVLFAMAVSAIGKKGEPILRFCDSLSQVIKFTGYVMMFAPIGVGAAMAHTIGTKGLGVLKNLALLMGSLYLALFIFVVVCFGSGCDHRASSIKQFLKAVREPFVIAFATTSSESALPKAMEVMERLGVPPRIVGFVMPTGYSFNLDGTTLYLAIASVFVAQAAEATTGQHMSFGKQIVMMLTLMITSKGVAAVPRASLVILLATLHSFGLPIEGVAVIFGIDELMDMGRTSVNVLGNCMATVVVARWEGEFDDERAKVFGTPEEAQFDIKHGEPAFAAAAADGD